MLALVFEKDSWKHTRGDEGVLGDAVLLKIIVERAEVLDLAGTSVIVGDRLEDDQRIVLAHVVVGIGLLVREVVSLLRYWLELNYPDEIMV